MLLIIGSLFLVIQTVAFVMGVSLARSITGSIHELFEGTRRVQAEDLSHRIRVRTRDQFGALASSFNSMVETIEELLEQKVVKERLQQELQLARDIQTSLLPSETLRRGEVTIAAACRPAREIGGDYCDFFPLDDDRIGLLVADVSGKGASAALYMAELKGLMLALSKTHQSPQGAAWRGQSRALGQPRAHQLRDDDLCGARCASADADACPRRAHAMIHFRAGDVFPRTRLLAPEGLVLGVRMESIRSRFEGLLKEHTITLAPGDVVVLFTDGISEAMNEMRDLYGEDRLCLCVEDHADLEPDALCDEIFESVREFADGAEQHDDMTMIVLKVGKGAAGAAPATLRRGPRMTGRTVVCTTTSEPEAALVAGLLEAEGFSPAIERSPLRSVFPVPIAFFGQLRVTVPDEEADEARRLLRRFDDSPPMPVRRSCRCATISRRSNIVSAIASAIEACSNSRSRTGRAPTRTASGRTPPTSRWSSSAMRCSVSSSPIWSTRSSRSPTRGRRAR